MLEFGWATVGDWVYNTESETVLRIDEPILFPGNPNSVPVDSNINLMNVSLKVTTILETPFVMINSEQDVDKKPFVGYCIDLLDKLQELLTTELTPPGEELPAELADEIKKISIRANL